MEMQPLVSKQISARLRIKSANKGKFDKSDFFSKLVRAWASFMYRMVINNFMCYEITEQVAMQVNCHFH